MSERAVLVTGCSSGFGRALVTALLARGFVVHATLRDLEARRDRFAEDTYRFGERLHLHELDVARGEDRAVVREAIRRGGGGLYALVNNAGYGQMGALEDLTEAQFRSEMEVNFFGTMNMCREFLPLLRAGRGRIVNLSSVLGFFGIPLGSAYCASKFAMEGLTESLYHELSPHGVQVCLVEPGGFRTNFGDNMRWGERSFAPDSPYTSQSLNLRALNRRERQGRGVPLERVVRKIVRLLEARRMPLRLRAGTDCEAMHWFRSLFPERAGAPLLAWVFGKLLQRKPPPAA